MTTGHLRATRLGFATLFLIALAFQTAFNCPKLHAHTAGEVAFVGQSSGSPASKTEAGTDDAVVVVLVGIIGLVTAACGAGKAFFELYKVRSGRSLTKGEQQTMIAMVSLDGDLSPTMDKGKWWTSIAWTGVVGAAGVVFGFVLIDSEDDSLSTAMGLLYAIVGYILVLYAFTKVPGKNNTPWIHSRTAILEGSKSDIIIALLLGLAEINATLCKLDRATGVVVARTGRQRIKGPSGREQVTISLKSEGQTPGQYRLLIKSESLKARKL